MTDLVLALAWLGVLAAGAVVCLVLRRAGVAATYVRDVLHVGAGVWALGWPLWRGAAVPIALATGVAAAIAAVPHLPGAARLEAAVAGGDERWDGLTRYALAAAVLTAVGLLGRPFPAAAALWALALGDGVGGAVGRRFGRRRYALPWGKPKSLEGSLTVALLAAVGVALAAAWFRVPAGAARIAAAGAVAALAEAAAPRASDNLVVPAAVWLLLAVTGGPP
jgi:CDP-diglyceride synthetase